MNRILLLLLLGTSLAAAAGCTTESYCFDDCEGESAGGTGGTGAGGTSGTGGASGTGGGCINCGGASGTGGGGTGGGGGCTQTNGGIELCDSLDNDCDGETDEDFDLSSDPYHCGTCDTNCTLTVLGAQQATCTATPGTPGECGYIDCSSDYYDLNDDRTDGCEYFCTKQSDTDLTCDNIDDDCNGVPDDGIDFCSSATNCGTCGRNCQGKAGVDSAQCVKIGDPPPTVCDEGNTKCEIVNCAPGYVDVDGQFPNGCEYACTKTKRTDPADPATLVDCAPNETCDIEYCDGVDNDCDGNVDGTDPDLLDPTKGDPALSKACTGAAFGECAKTYHTGITRCVAAQVKCVNDNTGNTTCTTDADCTDPNTPYCVDGPTGNKVCGTKVLRVNEAAEICDGLDNNCDNQVDVGSTDAGGKCGNNVGLCTQGTFVCSNAALVCSGAINPTTEICDGADNDCDGVTDGTATAVPVPCQVDGDCQALPAAKFCMNKTGGGKVCAALPSDIVDGNTPIACQVPPAAPAGWTSACQAGALACVSGAKVCLGAVTAQVSQDTCGVDANCDGQKSPDFNLDTDVHNCKACGTDCTLLGAHVNWICGATGCQPDPTNKCMPGFIDCDGNPNDCERPCTKLSNQELCNGIDDNCSCEVDEGVVTPSPTQVCGIGVGATGACLTTQVACVQGAWQCTYPAGHCTGASCAATQDICDGLDNNCNGNLDENFKPPILGQGYLGQVCASDDNVTPKHGLCQQTGTYKCATTSTTSCQNAAGVTIANVKLPCGTLAGQSGFPCDEACDGQDNDCDGIVDEPPRIKSQGDPTYWVKPNVVKLGTQNVWMFRYEATRPGATQTTPGTGNGWWRSTGMLTAQPTPPSGTTLDKTTACSVPSKVPWFNISGPEAQHVCVEMGGRLCRNSEWQSSCRSTTGSCRWGFANNCSTFNTTTNWTTCNLGPFDFNTTVAGNQDGLLPTGSSLIASCYANWGSATARVNDLTGNLRELTCPPGTGNPACTATTNNFTLMGGAFNTADPTGEGAACDFTFYNVSSSFKLFDVGFRCCFDTDPTI